jgi:V/A-type H+-transporting ATPase subunit E
MGLDELREEIKEDYAAKVAGLREESDLECARILSSAEEDAKNILSEAEKQAVDDAKALESRALAAARLEGRSIISAAREAVADRVLADVRKGLAKFTSSGEYALWLARALDKAVSAVKGGGIVYARNADRKSIKKYPLAGEDLDCIGGVIVKSKDSAVSADATLDSLFEESRPKIRDIAYRRLFQ